jgi:hypothetical protein
VVPRHERHPCEEKEEPRKPFFARVEELIDQVLFELNIPSKQERHESARDLREAATSTRLARLTASPLRQPAAFNVEQTRGQGACYLAVVSLLRR